MTNTPDDQAFPDQPSYISPMTDQLKISDPYEDVVFPNLLTRVKALVVDIIVILLIFTITSLLIDQFGGAPNWLRGLILIFSLYLYEPTLIATFGGTVGHHLVGIKIMNMKKEQRKLNILQSSIRFITKYMLGWISFLTITANKRRRAIHDMMSGSIVLYR